MFTRRKEISGHFHHVYFLLFFLLTLAAIFLFGSEVSAETWYVKPSAEIPIRSGQGTDYKILSVVPDGLKVEILEEDDPWVKVRTAGGTEGWMLKRYLSGALPLSKVVADLEAQKAKLEENGEKTNRKLVEISAAHSQLEKEFNVCRTERDEIQKTYKALRNDTADVLKIKQNLADKTQENQALKQKMATVEQQNKTLKRNTSLMWFLAGGALLLIGWIIGMMTGRSRKRKSTLL